MSCIIFTRATQTQRESVAETSREKVSEADYRFLWTTYLADREADHSAEYRYHPYQRHAD